MTAKTKTRPAEPVTEPGPSAFPTAPLPEVTVPAAALLGALNAANRVVGSGRSPMMPVYAGVALIADGATLTVHASDYGAAWTETLALDEPVAVPGAALVGRATLTRAVRSVGRGVDVTLREQSRGPSAEEGTAVAVTADTSDGAVAYRLGTMPLVEYPDGAWTASRSASTTALADLVAGDLTDLASAGVAASTDDTMPILQSVRLTLTVGQPVVAHATDRYRLAEQVSMSTSLAEVDVLVLAAKLSAVAAVLGKEPSVRLAVEPDGKNVLLGTGTRTARLATVEGQYPKVQSLFGSERPVAYVAPAGRLSTAVKRANLVVRGYSVVTLTETGGTVNVTCNIDEDETGYAEVAGASRTGRDVVPYTVNPRLFTEGLRAMRGGMVTVAGTSATKPWLLTGENRPRFRYLLMPARLGH